MNERIKELAEQATRRYDRLGNEIPFAQPNLKEFAELVQKDTIRECRDMFIVGSDSWFLLDEKLEHFGID